ncbi:MAG: AarF/ABC1/UbiB kinase family protein [Planctomycetota bacterium]
MAELFGRTLKLLSLGRSAFQWKGGPADATVAANARLTLIEKMGRLRGLPQKIGQILSMGSSDEAGDFLPLTNAAEPVPFEVIHQELRDALGENPGAVFHEIEPRGLAASLGQVHRARLKNDQLVAVKVRYPGIENAVLQDLKLLGWLTVPVGGLRRGFDMNAYREEILRDLEEELDYRVEAEHQRDFSLLMHDVPGLVVPRVFLEFSSERVLVTGWEEGEDIEQVCAAWPSDQKRALARQLLLLFCKSVLERGIVHADPHAGNYRFRRGKSGPEIILYDFGSCVRLDEKTRLALVRLMRATMDLGSDDPYALFLLMGFDPKTLAPLRSKLPALCRVMFEPFVAGAPYQLGGWRRSERIGDILGDDRWNFRISGPASLLFLMRAFHGLIYYLEKLNEPVNWTWQCRPILESQASAAGNLVLPVNRDAECGFQSLARHLVIHVLENNATKVKVTLPALAVDDLEEYLEGDVLSRIRQRGIDVGKLAKEVRQSGYSPRELFLLDEPPKQYHVWLE